MSILQRFLQRPWVVRGGRERGTDWPRWVDAESQGMGGTLGEGSVRAGAVAGDGRSLGGAESCRKRHVGNLPVLWIMGSEAVMPRDKCV